MVSDRRFRHGLNMLRGEYSVLTSTGSVMQTTDTSSKHMFKNCTIIEVPQPNGRKTHLAVCSGRGDIVFETNGRHSAIYALLEQFADQQVEEFSWRPYAESSTPTIECKLYARHEPKATEPVINRIVLDVETTGLDPEGDEILRLSIIDGGGAALLDETYKPEHTTSWPDAQRINRISPTSVRNRPPITDDIERIQTLLDRAQEVCAFNADFDLAFLGEIGLRLDTAKVRDSLREYGRAFHGSDYIKLTQAAEECNYRYNAHDSLSDCRATLVVQTRVDNYRERKAAKINWGDVSEPTRRPKKRETKTQARIYTALTWILLFLCAVLIAVCFAAPYMLIVAIPTCFICRACVKHARGMRERTGLSKSSHKGKHSGQQQRTENMPEPAAAAGADEAEYERRLAMEATKTVRQQAEANPPAASAPVPAVHIDEASVIPGDEPPMFMVRGSKVAKFKGDDGTDFTLYQRTIKCGREEHRLDGVEAVVEEGSALQSRFTATRIFLLGVFALAFKKRKGGEKWLGIMGPDFAWVSRADRKHIGDAMKFAAKVNDQARKQ